VYGPQKLVNRQNLVAKGRIRDLQGSQVSLFVELRNRICKERQMVPSFDCVSSRAFNTSLRRQARKNDLFDSASFQLLVEVCTHESVKDAMVAGDGIAVLGSKRLIELIPEITLPKNMVLPCDLQTRSHVFEIGKAMVVQTVRGVHDLKTSCASSSQESLQVWDELDALQLALDVVIGFPRCYLSIIGFAIRESRM
jgi:hypothetical protein